MAIFGKEKAIHRLFEYSVLLKGIHAVVEIAGGILLYFLSADAISSFIENLAESELLTDPNDFVATHLMNFADGLSLGGKSFAAFYLLSHGVIKLFLVIGLLRNKVWAYPASLVILALFIVYQMYRYTFTHSAWLIVLTVFDILVIWLVWHEFKLVREHKPLE